MSRQELRRKCEDAADLLVPFFSEEYDIDLHEPDFIVLSRDEFESQGRMNYKMKDSVSDYNGEVIVLYDELWPETAINKSVAHELGHVAKDINSKEVIDSVEYPKGKYVPCLDEGIAKHFEREGIRYLEKYFEDKDPFKSKCHKAMRLYEDMKLKKNRALPGDDKYKLGDKIFSTLDKEEVKEALERPKRFFKEVDFSSL